MAELRLALHMLKGAAQPSLQDKAMA
jgi:hypothetical protein